MSRGWFLAALLVAGCAIDREGQLGRGTDARADARAIDAAVSSDGARDSDAFDDAFAMTDAIAMPDALVDATPDGSIPDAAVMCAADPTACAAPLCECAGTCACPFECPAGACAIACRDDSTCTTMPTSTAEPYTQTCTGRASCTVEAIDTPNVDIDCTGEASCDVHCDGVVDECLLECADDAACHLTCTRVIGPCHLRCPSLQMCPDGSFVCGRSCP